MISKATVIRVCDFLHSLEETPQLLNVNNLIFWGSAAFPSMDGTPYNIRKTRNTRKTMRETRNTRKTLKILDSFPGFPGFPGILGVPDSFPGFPELGGGTV